MWLLLVAEVQISKGLWFEIADRWGNSASVVGLVLAVIGFPITWGIQWRIRRAAREALQKVALKLLTDRVGELHRRLTIAREACRLALWQRAYDCCHEAHYEVQRLFGHPHVIAQENLDLREGADNLTQVIRYLEANKLVQNPPAGFQRNKRAILDSLINVLTSIQTRLDKRIWEP